ncbi:hypothetical protein HZF05_21430 [Sphingomonas sp. CGMCC 1.13654]|uniref:Uncharacterized protein n=1 Tax=Sphingomonas chungangi TaxID=2683589 RepID=A0A838LCT4_9SPHN|nr:hypothetical protein [Sphingomonas chungangi]MBA2936650.1 hypothetical protein [Sphingomonas chungangi]MVW56035.1 hypothetical protein [Sphingomonas chungangi]
MHYRLYGLNPTTGRIMQGRDIAAETDREAIAAGRGIHPHDPFEIWCRSRRVFSSAESDAASTA